MCLILQLFHVLQLVSYLSCSQIFLILLCYQCLTKFSLCLFLDTISKLLHKTLLETRQLLRPLCSLPPLHSRTLPQLQRLFRPEQKHQIATALSHSHNQSTIRGQEPECHLKICLTSPGEGNACIWFNCKFSSQI